MLFVKFCNNLHDPSTRHMTYFTACVKASPRAEVLRTKHHNHLHSRLGIDPIAQPKAPKYNFILKSIV